MSRGRRPDFLPLFRFLLCLAAGIIVSSRRCAAQNHSQFRQRSVVVNVDGEEVLEENEEGTVSYGICAFVTASLEGVLDDASGSPAGLVPEDCFLYGRHDTIGYFRFNVGRKDTTLTVPATGEETIIPWHGLTKLSTPFAATRYPYVRDRQLLSVFDGHSFRSEFQIYYRRKQPFITSGLAMRASGYAGTDIGDTFSLYEDWFRARYNHNYEIRYDYGFVQAEKRGYTAEQGILHENLCYFALPKQLTDPGGDARYQFLGWRLSGDGTEYTPFQGSEKASFAYGQPTEIHTAALMSAAAPLSAAVPLSLPTLSAAQAAAEAAAEIRAAEPTASESAERLPDEKRSTASDLPEGSG